jgi:GMP synthase (glutamine-hydrolysing)
MNRLLIIKTGTTLAPLLQQRGDFEDWIRAGMGVARERVDVVSVFEGAELPDPQQISGAVITGSSAMVSHREPWSERTAHWLRGAVDQGTPILGICYGHQLLAHALGGRVAPNPLGREIGTVPVRLEASTARDPLLASFAGSLRIHVSHVESVLELPTAGVRLAASDGDPNCAFFVGPAAWGVQFHPEFDAHLMRGYIEERRALLRAENLDADALLNSVTECPDGTALLRRFSELVKAESEPQPL